MIGPIAITVVPANLDSRTKDIAVCVLLDLRLHTANRVRGEFSQSSSSLTLNVNVKKERCFDRSTVIFKFKVKSKISRCAYIQL